MEEVRQNWDESEIKNRGYDLYNDPSNFSFFYVSLKLEPHKSSPVLWNISQLMWVLAANCSQPELSSERLNMTDRGCSSQTYPEWRVGVRAGTTRSLGEVGGEPEPVAKDKLM